MTSEGAEDWGGDGGNGGSSGGRVLEFEAKARLIIIGIVELK